MVDQKKIFCKQNIPNMLLVFRMLLVPAIVALLIADWFVFNTPADPIIYHLIAPFANVDTWYTKISLFFLLSGIFFVIASITDWADGFIARRYNWVSDFGKLWDPIADKVLINSILICLSVSGIVPIYIPLIMIARDVCVDAQRMVAASKGVVIPANYWGKLKTVLQMVGTIFVFFFFNCSFFDVQAEPLYNGMYWGIQNLMLHLATVVSIISGVVYFIGINKALKNNGKQN